MLDERQPHPRTLADWLRAAAVHFERMETDEQYRNEVKRRAYKLDVSPPSAPDRGPLTRA
jgi:hypothetical protein